MGYKSSTSFSANLCDSINVTLLTNYSEGQKAALLKFATEPDEKTYLLFIVPGNAGNVAGFMPLNRSAGFIYTSGQSSDQINQTIAHELGHGAFGLDHVGKAADKAAAATDNLMDYSNSTALDKPQWDKMHSEYRRITWFQDAEEGMLNLQFYYAKASSATNDAYTGPLLGDYHTYYAPSGLPFSLPKEATSLSFSNELVRYSPIEKKSIFVSPKSLTSFKLNEKVYVAKATAVDFLGYVEKNNFSDEEKPHIDIYSTANCNKLDISTNNTVEYGVKFPSIAKLENYTAAGQIVFPEKHPEAAICHQCNEPMIRSYCGKACLCAECSRRRHWLNSSDIKRSVPIFKMDFETKTISFIDYKQNDNLHNQYVTLMLLDSYSKKFGNDETMMSMVDGLSKFLEGVDMANTLSENNALELSTEYKSALKILSTAGSIKTIYDINNLLNRADYSKALYTVMSFVFSEVAVVEGVFKFLYSESVLTSLVNNYNIQLYSLSRYSGGNAESLIKQITERRDNIQRVLDMQEASRIEIYHNSHCTCD